MDLEDTIVAISSPPGVAERGIARLSGRRAVEIAAKLIRSCDGGSLEDRAAPICIDARLLFDGGDLPSTVYLFRAPKSYTRQDVVELHTLGAPTVLAMLMEACLRAGARPAEPGEFTARAFFAGAMDLSQVHGVAGMIAAQSDLQLQAARRLLHGALARVANQAREELADLLSLVEGALDFADEPIEFITPAELRRRLGDVYDRLQATAGAGIRAERWGRLPRVVLFGPPNVGKSSLLNKLSGTDRAIATPIAGTTRDALSVIARLPSSECLLLDVAGFERAEDDIGAQAQKFAEQALRDAELILVVYDLTRPDSLTLPPPRFSDKPRIIVGNKLDLVRNTDLAAKRTAGGKRSGRSPLRPLAAHPRRPRKLEKRPSPEHITTTPNPHNSLRCENAPQIRRRICLTSSRTGQGCEDLKRMMEALLQDRERDADESIVALMAEHRDALDSTLQAVRRAIDLAELGGESLDDADVVASELHTAADSLGAIFGKDQTEEILGRIFSRFCVGK